LRFGVPPYRVATLYLDSGEWQAEDVEARMLGRAADRVVDAVRAAAASQAGRVASLTPGPYCRWCPRSLTCPSSSVASSVASPVASSVSSSAAGAVADTAGTEEG
ncbi:MAG: hypothetical protein ACRDHC_07950, partial [Actinomycetota bacterium]